MKNDTFTTDDYLKAIKREQGKRATTYPKILQKMEKQGAESTEILERKREMNWQNQCLQYVEYAVDGLLADRTSFYREALDELMRELKMRKSYYPRLIWFDRNRKSPRMTQETADYEIAVWESLTRWFAKEYLGLDELPSKRRKKRTE